MLRLPLDAFMASSTSPRLMENTFRLALTGTPGTGKTTIAALLSKAGFVVVTIEELAKIADALGDIDPADNAHPVDLDILCDSLDELWKPAPTEPEIIDGHLSHHLPADAVVVLRCDPATLRERLSERGYSSAKVESNVEWELLGGAWNEREGDSPWSEFDTTTEDADSVVKSILAWISDGFKPASPEGVIDWIARMDD
jgi:adenylate kinase